MIKLYPVPRTRGMAPAEAAASWVVRHDRGELSAREEAEFDDWQADPVNLRAYRKASGAIDVFDADFGADPHLAALRQAALAAAPEPRRHFPLAALAAAALVLVCLTGVIALISSGRFAPSPATTIAANQPTDAPPQPEIQHAGVIQYVTGIGERRTVALADGSKVTLNTRSRMTVAFTPGRRLIHLFRGQALFEVAHDKTRPFVVEAADRQVAALGTVFEVRVAPGRVHVVLIQGHVVVARTTEAANASETVQVKPAYLQPGQEFVAELGTLQQVAAVDVRRQLLWRDGFVEFDDEPLGRAVAEINRYASEPITLDNDRVAALRVSGIFRTGAPDQFVDAVRQILPIRARQTPQGGIILSTEAPPAH